MKVYDILSDGFALCGDDFSEFNHKDIAVKWLNISVAMALKAENILRSDDGRQPIYSVKLTDLSDEVPLYDEICQRALPLALACLYSLARGEFDTAKRFEDRFSRIVSSVRTLREDKICDIYR